MQQKKLNQVNHILKRIRCFCLSIFVVCLTLSICVPVNAATATEQSVVDDTTQQETKKADTQMKEQRTIRVGSFEDTFNYVDKNGSDEDLATNSCRLWQAIPDGNLSM